MMSYGALSDVAIAATSGVATAGVASEVCVVEHSITVCLIHSSKLV